MTKEEILDIWYKKGLHWAMFNRANVLSAMESYASQELQAQKDRAEKLVQAVRKILTNLDPIKESVWILKQALKEYESQ